MQWQAVAFVPVCVCVCVSVGLYVSSDCGPNVYAQSDDIPSGPTADLQTADTTRIKDCCNVRLNQWAFLCCTHVGTLMLSVCMCVCFMHGTGCDFRQVPLESYDRRRESTLRKRSMRHKHKHRHRKTDVAKWTRPPAAVANVCLCVFTQNGTR